MPSNSCFGAGLQDDELQAEAVRRGLEVLQLRVRGRAGRIDGNGERLRARAHLAHELQPLARDLHAQARHAGEIAARPRQAVHDAERDGIAAHLEDDRDRRRRRFRRERDLGAARRHDHRSPDGSASSFASAGSRLYWPSAHRNSIATLRPST